MTEDKSISVKQLKHNRRSLEIEIVNSIAPLIQEFNKQNPLLVNGVNVTCHYTTLGNGLTALLKIECGVKLENI